MKLFLILFLFISADAFSLTESQLLNEVEKLTGIEKSQIKRGMKILSKEAAKEIKKTCSVYIYR